MLRVLKHMGVKQWLMAVVSAVLIAFQVQLDLKLPDYMSEITKLVQTEGSAMSAILTAGGKMLLCALGSLVLAVMTGYLAAQIAARLSMNLRERVYNKVMSFSGAEMSRFSTPSLITRSTNDITQIQMFVAMGLQVMIKAPIMGAMAIGKISTKSWQWSLLTAGVIAFVLVIIVFIMVYAMPRFKRIQGLTDNLNRVTRENLTGLLVVRAYNAESYQEAKFEKANEDLTSTNLQAHLAMTVMNPGMNLAMNGLTLGIYWIGAALISGVALTSMAAMQERIGLFSDMVVFMSYAMQVIMAFILLIAIFIMLPRASVSAKRILEILDTEPSMTDGEKTQGLQGQKGEIVFRDVSFSYPDAGGDVLHNISFTAHRGQTVALIGATGCGKTSIIRLIPRLYDATEGEILVDGVNVKEYSQAALHQKIGYVPQKSFLFSGTVESNVAYGRENLSREGVEQSLSIAQAGFVQDTAAAVAQSGANFSGGQKQRLAIARAVALAPEILVFDDSFSALDYKTDRALRQALKEKNGDTTRIIVAQRIGTILDADQILVLEDGRIVGSGTHKELMASCPVYQEIAYSQLSKEELEA